MADITGTQTEYDARQNDSGYIKVTTPNTADDGDTIDIDLSTYGATGIDWVLGFTHSTEDSVVITEAPTTAVSSSTLTITIGGATDNKKRVFLVGLAN
jgi:hypothetical protein